MARKTRGGAAATIAARVNAQMKADVVSLGSDDRYEIKRIPTGILTIDRLLGGGFARGRHVELFGDWLVGKSLLAYMTMALAQERGEVCACIDAENVFDKAWFAELGGNPDELIMGEKINASTMGNVLRLLIQKTEEIQGVDIVLIDSVASLLPKEEELHDLEESLQPARLAALMSTLLRQLTMQNQDTLFLWTNQWRDKISRVPGLQSTPGGRALGFYASTRIEMAQGEKETEEVAVVRHGAYVKRKQVLGRWVQCTVRKEKTGARPESSKSFLLNYDTRRPDVARELIDLGMEDGLIVRHGDYYHVTGSDDKEIKMHGIKNAVKKIDADDELREWLVACVEEQTMAGANV
jgi:recombination protein RecA